MSREATKHPEEMGQASARGEESARPILVVGGPRTGTTWVTGVLHHAGRVALIYEPDNEWPKPFTLKAKFGLGRFPVLEPGDRAPAHYELLWERALAGYRENRLQQGLARRFDRGDSTMRALWHAMCNHRKPRLSPGLRLLTWLATRPSRHVDGRVVLVKSVYAPFALEWIAARFDPRMVVVARHPLNIISGWLDLGWGGCGLHANPRIRERFGQRWGLPELHPENTALDRLSWEVGLLTTALQAGLERHPEWLVASHDALCVDPEGGFRRLYEQLGLTWTKGAERYLVSSNRPGTGYQTLRVAAEQPEKWKKRLSPEQLESIWSVLSRFQAPWVKDVARDLG